MSKFFHGKMPSHPPKIQLLAEGHLNYCDVYNTVNVKVTKKRGTQGKAITATKLKLKDVLTNNSPRTLFCDEDIRYHDLEKKNNPGPLLITRSNLQAIAIRGARAYK